MSAEDAVAAGLAIAAAAVPAVASAAVAAAVLQWDLYMSPSWVKGSSSSLLLPA
jgi:hypothetical protein